MSAEIEVLNTEKRRVDIAVHLDGQPPARLVFLKDRKGRVKGHLGEPLNEKGRNGFVPRAIFLKARKIAIKRIGREDEQLRLFD